MDWVYLGLFFLGLIILIGITESIRILLKWSPEATRKIVHIITGILVVTTPLFFKSKLPLIVISLIFASINFLAIRFDFFKGMHNTKRRTYGTVFFPLAFIILLLLCWENHKIVLFISMLIMAISDASAAIVGENIKHPHVYNLIGETKSVEGSITMFITSMVIVFIGLEFGNKYVPIRYSPTPGESLWIASIVGLIATVTEALSVKGSDNLSVPLSVGFMLHFMLSRFDTIATFENIQMNLGILLGLLIVVASFYLRFLDAGGAAGTFLLAVVVFGIGGWKFGVPILAFFILSSLLSKLGKEQKKKLQQTFQKSSQRDIGQVIANGGIAGILVLLWNYQRHDLLFYMYLGALAAVTADTWGTEIGFFAKKLPRLILNFKPVPKGTSGGITLLGTLAGFLGAIVIGLSGWLVNPDFNQWNYLIVIGLAGMLASFADSFFGATIQARFQCPLCHKITEKTIHCNGTRTTHISGWEWVDNDIVNIICAFFGVFFVWLAVYLFL